MTGVALQGHAALTVSPALNSLGANGGLTETMRPNDDSPVLGLGDPAVCSAAPVSGMDQRGYSRDPTRCSIGSIDVETLGAACAKATDCYSGFCVDGVCCESDCGNSNTTDCQACSRAAGGSTDGFCTLLAATVICRPSVARNDPAEMCTGQDAFCPPDVNNVDGGTGTVTTEGDGGGLGCTALPNVPRSGSLGLFAAGLALCLWLRRGNRARTARAHDARPRAHNL